MLNNSNLRALRHYGVFGDGFCNCHICREKRLIQAKWEKNVAQAFIGFVIGIAIFMASCGIVQASEPIDLQIISTIESGGHLDAYNSHSKAVGMYQITQDVIDDYNRYHYGGTIEQYDLRDMFDFVKSYYVCDWYINKQIPQYFKHYHIEDTVKNRLWAYNAGIGNVVKGRMPKETKDYIKKYYRLKGGLNG